MDLKQGLAVFAGGFGIYTVLNPAWMIGLIAKVPVVGGLVSTVVGVAPPVASGIAAVVFGLLVVGLLGIKPKSII